MRAKRIKVLLADDSIIVRHLVTAELAKDPSLEVLEAATNGRAALAGIAALDPDVVVLDIQMPGLDGLATLTEIRRLYRRLPVIMFSTLTEAGVAATLEALARGANDYVTKPRSNKTASQVGPVCQEISDKIKALCESTSGAARPDGPRAGSPILPIPLAAAHRAGGSSRIDAVVIGISTGGPNALAEMIPALPPDLPVPVLIAQHMPPIFTRLLAERLAKTAQLPVAEASTGETVTPGRIWIAPGDLHMVVHRSGQRVEIRTHQAPRENSCRPSADLLFRSVAEVYGQYTLGVVMTGMGQDGLQGSRLIRKAGGHIIVQDEASSVVWGMPGYVARAGLAERIVPLRGLADAILSRVRSRVSGGLREEVRRTM
jgi:two-component system chemotaxis response regulator CheB